MPICSVSIEFHLDFWAKLKLFLKNNRVGFNTSRTDWYLNIFSLVLISVLKLFYYALTDFYQSSASSTVSYYDWFGITTKKSQKKTLCKNDQISQLLSMMEFYGFQKIRLSVQYARFLCDFLYAIKKANSAHSPFFVAPCKLCYHFQLSLVC